MRAIVGMTTAMTLAASVATAQDDNRLYIEGEEMVSTVAAPSHMENVDTIYSGWHFRSAETQALEVDDFDNPAMIWVDEAREMWDTAMGSEDKSCASNPRSR